MQNQSMRIARIAGTAAAAVLLGCLLLICGCGPSGPVMNQNYLKVVPTQWVSLAPGATEISPLLTPRLIGRTASDTFPESALKLPIVAGVKPDYEQIAALKPDFLICDPALYSASDMEKLKSLNIPIYSLDGDTVEAYFKSVYAIASNTQSEVNVNDYINRVRSEMSAAKADPITVPHKAVLLMPFPNSNPMIAGTGSFYADLVRCAGGDPIGPDGNKFETISPEALIKLDPDVVIIAGGKKPLNTFMSDPRFSALRAVKQGHVFSIDADLVERRGERVDLAISGLHAGLGKVLEGVK